MNLFKVYEDSGFKYTLDLNDEITKMVIEFVKDEENVDMLKKINDYGIQPALAFIIIKSSEIKKFGYKFDDDQYKKYYGTLFGAIFYYDEEYDKDKSRELPISYYLHNATLFKK